MSRLRRKIKWGWVNLCRLILSGTFILSGFVKAVDPRGTQYKLEDYAEAFHLADWVSGYLYLPAAILLAVVEFCLGIYLFFGIRRRTTTWALLILMSLMTPFTLYLALANPVSDCGCFGDAFKLTNWETFYKNVVLLLAAVSVCRYPRLLNRFISERNQWMVSMYSIFFIWIFSGWCVYRLPVLDFRPYHIGADLVQGMSIPEDAEQPEFETTFILEKNGVRKEFTEQNYPDSTWTFVDSRTVMTKAGYEPPVHDFSITEYESGEDITEQILRDTSYTFLLVSPFLEHADDSNMDQINEIFDYCREQGYSFYCLTASGPEFVTRWQDLTGAEYPFCVTDAITLKTIVRSNPGLVLLKQGVVINKWSVNNLPDESEFAGRRLEQTTVGTLRPEANWLRVMKVLFWYVVPLLLLTLLDRIWIAFKMNQRTKHKKRVLNLIKQQENEKENCSR